MFARTRPCGNGGNAFRVAPVSFSLLLLSVSIDANRATDIMKNLVQSIAGPWLAEC